MIEIKEKSNKNTLKYEYYFGVFYFAFFLIHYFFNISFNITYVIWTSLGLGGLLLFYFGHKEYQNIIKIFFIIDLFAAIGTIVNKNHSIFIFMSLPAEEFLGLLIYYYRKRLIGYVIVVYTFTLYIIFFIVTQPKVIVDQNWGEYGFVFSKLVQTNTVSIFLLLFAFIILLDRFIHKKRKPYIYLLVCMAISIYCGGKGGMLSLAILLVLTYLQNWKKKIINKKRLLLIVIAGTVFFINFSSYFLNSFFNDNSRFYIWRGYLECANSSIVDFIFGANVEKFTFLFEQKNCHNTFINWHYYYGFVPFLLLTLLLLFSIFLCIIKKNYFLLSLFCAFGIRAFTDESGFVFISLLVFGLLFCMCKEYCFYQKKSISKRSVAYSLCNRVEDNYGRIY